VNNQEKNKSFNSNKLQNNNDKNEEIKNDPIINSINSKIEKIDNSKINQINNQKSDAFNNIKIINDREDKIFIKEDITFKNYNNEVNKFDNIDNINNSASKKKNLLSNRKSQINEQTKNDIKKKIENLKSHLDNSQNISIQTNNLEEQNKERINLGDYIMFLIYIKQNL